MKKLDSFPSSLENALSGLTVPLKGGTVTNFEVLLAQISFEHGLSGGQQDIIRKSSLVMAADQKYSAADVVQAVIDFELKDMNFHQIMVRICDQFQMTHIQMMALRQKLEKVYNGQFPYMAGSQQPVSVQALATVAYRHLAKGGSFDDLVDMKQGKLIKKARKIE
jgi:hypothetical protein